jgi:hypothetical protein
MKSDFGGIIFWLFFDKGCKKRTLLFTSWCTNRGTTVFIFIKKIFYFAKYLIRILCLMFHILFFDVRCIF